MTTDFEMPLVESERIETSPEAPSAEFIHAISEFLDTDPSDLLSEMGYTHREDVSEMVLAG